MYKVEVTPVVGLPQFTGWSHVASSAFPSGQLVCALAVRGEHAGNVGRDLTEIIATTQVESAADVHQLLLTLQRTATDMDTKLHVAVGFFSPTKMAIGALGGCVFLKRDQRMGVLLKADTTVKLIEGRHQPQDLVVLATQQAESMLPEIQQKFTTGFEVDSVIASIIPGLHSLHDSSASSLAFVIGGEQLMEMLDIPPALMLRGAGKRREMLDNEITQQVSALEPSPTPVNSPIPASTPAPVDAATPVSAATPVNAPTLVNAVHSEPINPPIATQSITPTTNFTKTNINNLLISIRHSLTTISQSLTTIGHRLAPVRRASILANYLTQLMRVMVQGVHQTLVALQRRVRAGRLVSTRARTREIYLHDQSGSRPYRVIIPLSVLVIAIVGVLAWWMITTRRQVTAAETAIAPYFEQLTSARALLNEDPLAARAQVQTVIQNLQQLESEFAQRKAGQKVVATQLIAARSFYDEISGMEAINELEIFYDIRLADSEFVASRVDATDAQLVFLDEGRRRAVVLTTQTKEVKQIDVSSLNTVKDLAVNDQTIVFLGNGIGRAQLDGTTTSTIINEGDSNRTATLIENFATYIYVFNPEKRNIYRYSRQTDTYSDPIGWVSGAAGFDFTDVTSWAIDGQVWIGTRQGKLHLLESGREQPFEIKGMEKPFTSSLNIFTREDFQYLYVLEADNHRLVVLKKDGAFVKEISSPSLASVTSVVVDESQQRAYAVSGSIVYAINLN